MAALLIMILAFIGYIIMYQLYGKFIGNKIFALSAAAKAPSVELEDGTDYVPTKKEVIFGHHFTSIAGTGPIVGPAIAIIWGWLPAMIWIFVGTIIMGAVHDLALSLFPCEIRENPFQNTQPNTSIIVPRYSFF